MNEDWHIYPNIHYTTSRVVPLQFSGQSTYISAGGVAYSFLLVVPVCMTHEYEGARFRFEILTESIHTVLVGEKDQTRPDHWKSLYFHSMLSPYSAETGIDLEQKSVVVAD